MIINNIPKIKVVGIGGSGVNAVSRMHKEKISGVELIAVNTDDQSLKVCPVAKKILIGKKTTGGFGAGMDVIAGEKAARESYNELKQALEGAELVFLTCGLGGGCLRGSSLVLTNPKGPIRIDSIAPGSMVYSFEGGSLVKRKVLSVIPSGVKKIFEVKTNNRTIYASGSHPFLKVEPSKLLNGDRFSSFDLDWVKVENLKNKDLVVILRKVPDDGKPLLLPDNPFLKESNKHFCQLFGFLLGDGWITESKRTYKICFSPSHNETLNAEYLSFFKEIFGLEMKRTTSATWYYVNSKKIFDLLERLELHKTARRKEIPNWLFKLPESQKKAFIIGLADADGSYSTQLGKTGLPKKEIKFEMGSENLIKGLKILCDSIGLRTSNVSSRTRILQAPGSREKKETTSWTLRIYKTHELLGDLPHPKARSGESFLYKFRNRQIPEFFDHFGFNRIKSVREVGEEEVYDITVEGSHNFVADGFVVHNSGTAGISVLGEIAKSIGALTIAVVTSPFSFEGAQRKNIANWGLKRLEGKVDSFLVIQNDRLLKMVGPSSTVENAFWVCDSILREAVKGISDLVSLPGIINVDFADLRSILVGSGRAFLGIGRAKGEKRALSAASSALQSPLLDFSLKDAQGILLNIAGGDDLSITEVNMAATFIKKNALPQAKIIFGVSEDSHLESGELKIILIATSKG